MGREEVHPMNELELSDSLLIRFVQNLMKNMKRLGISLYSSKYSKHDFTFYIAPVDCTGCFEAVEH
jgi:NAD-dependent dihydropyrimidine dehydrogenase PreA subunit